jgi:hypothetical protein
VEKYLHAGLEGIFDFVARQTDDRHVTIFLAGVHIGALEAATWAMDHRHLFAHVELRIIDACRANGYIDHPNGGEPEILRTFNDGRRAGAADSAPEPELYESQSKEPGPTELDRPAIEPLVANQRVRQQAQQLALPALAN